MPKRKSCPSLPWAVPCRFFLLVGFLVATGFLCNVLPTVEGAAIPVGATIRGFRIRGDNNANDITDPSADGMGGVSDSDSSSLRKDSWLGSFFGNLRNERFGKRETATVNEPLEQQQAQLPQQQQGMPLAWWVLAANSWRGLPGGGAGKFPRKLLGAVLKHPKWVLVGGCLYQGQKALRSEPLRRATRFWVKIGPLVVHYKFARWWLKRTKAPLEKRDAVYGRLHDQYSPVAMDVALELKGLYVKLAQVVSSRPDFVPLAYIQLFVAAQDSLPQWPIEEVKELIDAALLKSPENTKSSLSDSPPLSFDTVFEDIDAIALGSASIGQCHRAKLKGRYARELLGSDAANTDPNDSVDVAVKIMHPGAEERFRHDFSVFRWLCKVALTGWEPILNELYRQVMSEFDYRQEANSLETVRTNMIHSPFRTKVTIPKPLQGLCSKELLVMELLDGPKLSESLEDELSEILGADRSKQLLDRKRLELVLGKDKLKTLESSSDNSDAASPTVTEENLLQDCGWATKLQLLKLYRRAQNTIDMLVDVQGYQMLKDGVFQGDPHPGNILELNKAKGNGISKYYPGGSLSLLGLIDYGQTKFITDEERLGVAKVILALGADGDESQQSSKTQAVADAMRELGFSTKRNDAKVLEQYAGLFFDSDEVGKKLYDCPTPQTYFKRLTELDPLVTVPDVAVFVARCGFLLRGMGSILGKQIKTSERWSVYAKQALEEAEQNTK